MENKYVVQKNSGSLFKTKEKKHEKSPDFGGEILIDVENLKRNPDGSILVKISGWKLTSKNGLSYISLKVDQWSPESSSYSKPKPKQEEDDDIPF